MRKGPGGIARVSSSSVSICSAQCQVSAYRPFRCSLENEPAALLLVPWPASAVNEEGPVGILGFGIASFHRRTQPAASFDQLGLGIGHHQSDAQVELCTPNA